jgi:hypothetical protein
MKKVFVVTLLASLLTTSPAFGIYKTTITYSAFMHGSPAYATPIPITVVEQTIVVAVQSVEPVLQNAPTIPTCASLNSLPAVGQSCTLPVATTDYSLPTSVVQDPGTLGFTSMPTSGTSTYTPTVAAGTTSAPVTISAVGACSANNGTVTVSGSGSCTIVASQPGAENIQQTFITGTKE